MVIGKVVGESLNDTRKCPDVGQKVTSPERYARNVVATS